MQMWSYDPHLVLQSLQTLLHPLQFDHLSIKHLSPALWCHE
jgi:hypothetical protein